MGYWGEVRGIGLQKYSFQRYILDCLGDAGLLVGEHTSDADVPVAELLKLAVGFGAAAVGVEHTPE